MEDLYMIKDILSKANIGIWAIEIDEDSAPRMYADLSMRVLLGIDDSLSPEATYEWWYSRIHPDYYDAVTAGVDKIISGNHAEILYPWEHPKYGQMYVRCGGIRNMSYSGGIRLEGCHQDVSDLIQFQKDPLTDLYTKDFFFERAKEIINENPDKKFRILVSDIENFKVVNDKYGTETGDEVLKYLAKAARTKFGECLLGGRIYADKFVFLQYAETQTRANVMPVEREILANAPVPNLIWKHGIYYVKENSKLTVSAMFDRARLALESIKGVYGVYCAVYDDKVRDDLLTRQKMIDNMESALRNEEFQVYLQPKHDLHADKTGGAEALVRWIHPELGFMNPGVFIPIFESNGFVRKLDQFVIGKVCEIIRDWIDNGKICIPISVNLSRKDFEVDNLAEMIIDQVDSYGVPYEMIHFELTESAFSENPERISETINILHDNGFVIELDDFGTGYSSLITLTNLAFDVLKLDMSIIKGDKPDSERNILNYCTQLVKMLKLKSVAEGVETKEQLERLKSLGCDYIQGYYFSKPLSVADFEEYLCRA